MKFNTRCILYFRCFYFIGLRPSLAPPSAPVALCGTGGDRGVGGGDSAPDSPELPRQQAAAEPATHYWHSLAPTPADSHTDESLRPAGTAAGSRSEPHSGPHWQPQWQRQPPAAPYRRAAGRRTRPARGPRPLPESVRTQCQTVPRTVPVVPLAVALLPVQSPGRGMAKRFSCPGCQHCQWQWPAAAGQLASHWHGRRVTLTTSQN